MCINLRFFNLKHFVAYIILSLRSSLDATTFHVYTTLVRTSNSLNHNHNFLLLLFLFRSWDRVQGCEKLEAKDGTMRRGSQFEMVLRVSKEGRTSESTKKDGSEYNGRGPTLEN